jgi:peptidoglycan/xylan/chitin deacetylase (PgdA/CDA1 family)
MKNLIVLSLFSLTVNMYAYDAVVLAYHGISDKKTSMNTSLSLFKEQMNYLHQNNFNVISSDELYNTIKNKKSFSPKTVVLTFDDGWKNQNQAMEVLSQYHYPATFGLVTNYQFHNYPTGLQKEDFEKYKNENFTYINHSYTHEIKKFLRNPQNDLNQTHQTFNKVFGYLPKYYVYPYGKNSLELINTLKHNNYLMAYSVNDGLVSNNVDLFRIPRNLVNESLNLNKFANLVNKTQN